jgi:hypothetical protein
MNPNSPRPGTFGPKTAVVRWLQPLRRVLIFIFVDVIDTDLFLAIPLKSAANEHDLTRLAINKKENRCDVETLRDSRDPVA